MESCYRGGGPRMNSGILAGSSNQRQWHAKGAVVLPHHNQQASDDENQTEHDRDHFLLTCFR
jgi:hypothetical protein